MTDEKTLLELRNLEIEVDTPRGPIRPVSGISLSIPKGKTLALVGDCLLYTSPSPRDTR